MSAKSELTESYRPAETSQDLLDMTLGDLLRRVANDVPERIALVEGVPERARRRRWTYAQLLREAEQVAFALLGRFQVGECVVVYAANSPEWVLLQHGMSLAGIMLVPVNPAYTTRELEYVARNCNAAGIFFDEAYRGRDLRAVVRELRAACLPNLREEISMAGFETFAASGRPTRLPQITPDQILQVQYTSGTTGHPKGALLHHRGVINTARNVALRIRFPDGGVHVNAMPMFHIAGSAVAEFGVIAQRGTFVLMSHFDAGAMLEMFESERCNATLIVPTMILALLDHPERASHDVSSMQTILSGAANVPAALVRRTQELLNCSICIIFGQTESNGPITVTGPDDSIADQTETVGRPLPHVEVKVVDPISEATAPLETVGEIWVRGYQTMPGYLDLPEASKATVREDGWLRTGDLGTMDHRGYLRITGRLKEMIIRGGMHLYPKEMEDVLFDHPEVAQVSVFGVPHEKWGEIVAAVILARDPDRPPAVDELFRYCVDRLATQKIPELWCFVREYPLTPSGKIQKPVLQQWIAQKRLTPVDWARPPASG